MVRPLGRQLRVRHRRRGARAGRRRRPARATRRSAGRCAWLDGAPERGRRLGRGPALLRRPGVGRPRRRRPRRRPRGRCWRCWPPASAAGRRASAASRWLVDTQRPDGTWDEPQFTGTGFPGDFYINYHLYRLVFPVTALGRYAARDGARVSARPDGRHAAAHRARRRARRPARRGVARCERTGARPGPRRGPGPAPRGRPGRSLVAGVAGALGPALRPGDVVVADRGHRRRGTAVACPSAPLLAGALRRRGLTGARRPAGRQRPRGHRGRRGAGWPPPARWPSTWSPLQLAAAAGGRPFAAVRAVVDTPTDPLLSPGTVARGVRRAARRCARPRRRSREWAAALGPREVVLAAPAVVLRRGRAGDRRPSSGRWTATARRSTSAARSCTTPTWSRDLERRGAVFVEELDEVPDGAAVVLAAHGVAPAVRAEAGRARPARRSTPPARWSPRCTPRSAGTPARRHRAADRPRRPRGGRGHPRRGARRRRRGRPTSTRPRRVDRRDPERVAYAMQTTLAVDEAERDRRGPARAVPGAARRRARDDICYATTNRQDGGPRRSPPSATWCSSSARRTRSNSVRLVEVAERAGVPAHLVEDAGDVDLRWLAGAAPDRHHRRRLGPAAPGRRRSSHCLSRPRPGHRRASARRPTEDVAFTLPKEVS